MPSRAAATGSGAADTSAALIAELDQIVTDISQAGGTPLVVAEKSADGTAQILGVIYLKDVVKAGLAARFADLRRMGIPHGDDHGRQPADGQGHRGRGRRRRLSRPRRRQKTRWR